MNSEGLGQHLLIDSSHNKGSLATHMEVSFRLSKLEPSDSEDEPIS